MRGARRSGWPTRTYVLGIEQMVRNPTRTVLERLAEALEVRIGALPDREEIGVEMERG